MERLPFYLVLVQSFPETVILVYLGLGVTGLKLDWRRILLVSLLITLASYLIRPSPLPAGISILIQLLLLVGLLSILGRLSFARASLVGVLGLVVLSFFEITFNALITAITGISITQVMNDPWMHLLFPLPEFAVLGLIAFLLNKYREPVLEWSRKQYPRITHVLWKSEIAFLLLLSVILIAFGFYYENYIGEAQPLSSPFISNAMYCVIFAVIAVSLLLVQELYFVQKQNRLVEAQRLHIENLQEMMQVIKGQRHDFINHIQVIYGFLSIQEGDKAREYVKQLYQDVQISGDVLQLGIPALSAMLLVKMGAAEGKNISLNIEIETSLADLRVPSSDVVAVAGNLINNALEAVEDMDPENRTVKLGVYTESGFHVIQVHNPGYIPEEIQNRIFEAGFSTRESDRERGIGLPSVKYLVEKYQGRVTVNSHPDEGTCFTVYYPQSRERRKRNEHSRFGSSLGSRAGQGIGQ
ncbi:MAG: Spo0B domain-containing protein [Syntrophomonadaceae bacterium]|nr:Spo0B domain-containing protein [Syntrophomonadaceae bacterium]